MVKRVLVLTVGLLLLAGPAWADAVADFYKGKTIRIVVGYGPGGTTDLTTRLIGRALHMYSSSGVPGSWSRTIGRGQGSMLGGNRCSQRAQTALRDWRISSSLV